MKAFPHNPQRPLVQKHHDVSPGRRAVFFFWVLVLVPLIGPWRSEAAVATQTLPAITHADGGSYTYTTSTAGDHLLIQASGANSIDLRYRSSATISTSSAGGVNGNVTLAGGILLGPQLSTSNPGFLTINAAGNFSSGAGLTANTDSVATITATSLSFAGPVNATRNATLTFNGTTSITAPGGSGLYSGLGAGITVNGNLTINSLDGGLSVGGGDAGFIEVNGTSSIHASRGMGVSVFQDNTATFNGYAHIVADNNYGVYSQGSDNYPEALIRFTDVLIESGEDGIVLLFNGSAIEVSGTAEVVSGEVGVYSYNGRGEFNNLKIVSQDVGIFSDNRNSTTLASTVTVSGTVDITASNDAGVQAYRGGTINLNNGTVRGSGDEVHGLHALDNGQILVNGQLGVSTDGANAHGLYADSGEISNSGQIRVSTTGQGSHGVYATNDGRIVSSGTLSVTTRGEDTYGLYADAGGQISSTGTINVTTSGAGAAGVYVTADGTILADGLLAVQTSGDGAYGLYLEDGGTLGLSAGLTITTSGAGSHALYLDQGNELDVTGPVIIQTSGAQSYGIYAINGSDISMSGATRVATTGDGSYGMYATDNGRIASTGTLTVSTRGEDTYGLYTTDGGVITSNGPTTVTTSGADAMGVYVAADGTVNVDGLLTVQTSGAGAHAITVEDGGTLGLSAGLNSTTSGAGAYGLYLDQGNDLNVGGPVTIQTSGAQSYGIYAANGSAISINGTSNVTTRGNGSYGVYATEDGRIATSGNLIVSTGGDNAYGLYAVNGGEITSGQTSVSTTGDGSYGVHATEDGRITTSGALTVTTSGDGALGVYVPEDGTITTNGLLAVETSGVGAHGVFVQGNGRLVVPAGLDSTTRGAAAHGLYLDQGSTLDVARPVSIQASGAQAYGVYADNASKVTLHGGNIAVMSGSYALLSDNSSTLNLDRGIYDVRGTILADNNSEITMEFAPGSTLVGASSLGNGTSVIDFTLEDSLWDLSGVSEVSRLTATNSNINLTGKTYDSITGGSRISWLPFGNELTVGSLGGTNSTFLMRTDIVNEAATRLLITGTSSGAHKLYVYNEGGAQTTGNEMVDLVYDAGTSRLATFSLSHAVELGGWMYELDEKTDAATGDAVWYLRGMGTASSIGSDITNIFRASRYLSLAETQTLVQRMGELRAGATSNEVWVRGYGGGMDVKEGKYARDFSMTYGGIQVGGDKKFEIAPNASRWGDLYVGTMFGYTYGDLDFWESGEGSVDSKTLGAYATVIGDNGLYTDLILKGMWMNNKLSGRDSAGEGASGDVDRFGAGLSLEVGKRFAVADTGSGKVYVEPQAQLSYNWYEGGMLRASNGLHMELDDYEEGMGRVALQAGYQWETDRGSKYNLYGVVSYAHAFGEDVSVRVNDACRVKEEISDRWWSVGVGLTANVADNHNLYLEYGYAHGNTFRQPWAVKAGWRMTF